MMNRRKSANLTTTTCLYFMFASNLKRAWEGDSPVINKVKPGGRLSVLARLSTMMLWLTPNAENADGAPAAIILKARLGQFTIKNKKWVPRRVLPERVPHFSWQDIFAYLANPADLANPAPGESMTEDERDMISELLNDEQMRLMVLGAKRELLRARSFVGSSVPTTGRTEEETQELILLIQEALLDGFSNQKIIGSIEGATLPLIIKVKRNLEEGI